MNVIHHTLIRGTVFHTLLLSAAPCPARNMLLPVHACSRRLFSLYISHRIDLGQTTASDIVLGTYSVNFTNQKMRVPLLPASPQHNLTVSLTMTKHTQWT
ncbi:hypothetical protein B0T25DRAFT_560077 [Lasiosphaeria hispida]|uniref:Uncharacterized protein n=1 Tax=Lasiosphaeria hispida TaxID=260671 RepID=A0AAJ0H881_9PEZI|nr:hypothetical protein B0T25DRAFT_560077 [Lasiosphaeria hispida]